MFVSCRRGKHVARHCGRSAVDSRRRVMTALYTHYSPALTTGGSPPPVLTLGAKTPWSSLPAALNSFKWHPAAAHPVSIQSSSLAGHSHHTKNTQSKLRDGVQAFLHYCWNLLLKSSEVEWTVSPYRFCALTVFFWRSFCVMFAHIPLYPDYSLLEFLINWCVAS